MPVGSTFPSESRTCRDSRTGVQVRQVTNYNAIHHHPFYYIPAFNAHSQLFLVSHRLGSPQLYMEPTRGGRLVQLTDRPNLNEWSCHPSLDGRYVYYSAGSEGWRVDLQNLAEEQIAKFAGEDLRQPGMVGPSMATTSLSTDGRWWCVFAKAGELFRMHIVDTHSGNNQVILERDTIAHPQFHPDDSSLLRYAGPHQRRVWIIHRDGSQNRLAYKRNDALKEWIVHESWLPGSREILVSNWPRGVMAIDTDSSNVRWIVRTNAWHTSVSRQGSLAVSDTTNPDLGLILFDPRRDDEEVQCLCDTEASNRGDHWHCDHCPYDDGPVNVNAPQHTHPHPSFSYDGRHVVFTSDRTGKAQIYEVQVPDL